MRLTLTHSKDTEVVSLMTQSVVLNLITPLLLLVTELKMDKTTTLSETLGATVGVNLDMPTLVLFQDSVFVVSNKFLSGQQLTEIQKRYKNL